MRMPPFQGWIYYGRSNSRGVAPGYMDYAPLGLNDDIQKTEAE
jgi:hypothetical protein